MHAFENPKKHDEHQHAEEQGQECSTCRRCRSLGRRKYLKAGTAKVENVENAWTSRELCEVVISALPGDFLENLHFTLLCCESF